MLQWKSFLSGTAIAVLALSACYLAVSWLTRAPLARAEESTPDLEASWNEAISRLGIDPIYPPEEDIMVGDLLARVVADEPDPNIAKNNKLNSQSPFLRRTVKIAHLDLREQLDAFYATIAVFPAGNTPQTPAIQDPHESSQSKSPTSFSRTFTRDIFRDELPYAAFPHLKIQGLNSAGAGGSGGVLGSANFDASNQDVEELQLKDVRAYGLPAARALDALSAYCLSETTKADCLEATARQYLEPYVGPRIYNKYLDASGSEHFGVKIEVALVNRVYLTGSILHLQRLGRTQSGGLRVSRRSTDTSPTQPEEQPSAPAQSSSDIAAAESTTKRIDDIEAQLKKLSPAGVLTFQSETGSDVLLEETFGRPVAFGIRTVRLSFPPIELSGVP
jgi:hypothetical protein